MFEIRTDVADLERLNARFAGLLRQATDPRELLEQVAGMLETQTKRRIADEKTAPDGTAWAEWSDNYKKTRKAKHSLLIDTQALLDDIASTVEGSEAIVFASMVYAGAHQDSQRESLVSRPFLGISAANQDELIDVIEGWLNGAIT